ncbi:hypothetical protein ACWENA_37750 [Streptomyces sp. NPDC004779]
MLGGALLHGGEPALRAAAAGRAVAGAILAHLGRRACPASPV